MILRSHVTSPPHTFVHPPARPRSGRTDLYAATRLYARAARPRFARADRGAAFIELHLALLLPHHRSVCCAYRADHAKSRSAGGGLVVRCSLAVLAAGGPALRVPAIGRSPQGELSPSWSAAFITWPLPFSG